MAINEATLEYYCYRNPKHGGRNLVRLFKALKISKEFYKLIDFKEHAEQIVTQKQDTKDYTEWDYFQPAWENEEAVSYLSTRLFSQPVDVARKFNLRVAREGQWAGRLLIPLTMGWTGRAMRENINLRYDAYTSEDGFYLYSQNSSSCIVVEGALDAIRVASTSNQFDVVAKCRMVPSPALLKYLKDKKYLSIHNVPDKTVPFSQQYNETVIIRSYCTMSQVSNVRNLPKKDFCDMTESETRRFLQGDIYGKRNPGEDLHQLPSMGR